MAQATDAYRKRLYLSAVGDDFSPAFVSEVLGIKPTKSVSVGGNVNPRKKALRPVWWLLISSDTNCENELFSKLMHIVDGKKDNFWKLKEEGVRFMVTLAIVEREFMPGLILSEDIIRFMSDFGLFLDIDIYTNT